MKAAAPPRITLLAHAPELQLSREAFFSRSGATQKGRILEAATHVIAEHGYANATVQQIVKSAGVSRTTFYELFAGKKECFLESYEVATHLVLALVAEAATAALDRGWRAAFAAGLDAYLDIPRSEPEIVRAQFVELGALGVDAVVAKGKAQRAHTQAVSALAELARNSDPTTPALEPGLIRLIIAGIDEAVALASATNDPGSLDELRSSALAAVERLNQPTKAG